MEMVDEDDAHYHIGSGCGTGSSPLISLNPNPNPNNNNDYSHASPSPTTTQEDSAPRPPPPGLGNPNINIDAHHQHPPHQPHLVFKEALAMQASAATLKNGAESSSAAAVDTRILLSSSKASILLLSSNDAGHDGTRTTLLRRCFTAKEINSGIISSEDTRVFCSIMIALLVVIAYANLPRHIVKSESLIASRPLYVLLLTDLIIVILRVSNAKHQRHSIKILKQEGESNNWVGAIQLLEWGLVLYQTVRAIFIDCSFYIVIVTCGFAFM